MLSLHHFWLCYQAQVATWTLNPPLRFSDTCSPSSLEVPPGSHVEPLLGDVAPLCHQGSEAVIHANTVW